MQSEMKQKYTKIAVLAILYIGIGIISYFIFKEIAFKKEINRLKNVIQDSPEKIEEKHQLGLLYTYRGDFKRAEEEFLGILAIDSYNTRALMSIGMMYYHKGEPHQALHYWRSLLEMEPGNQFIWDLVNKVDKNNRGERVSHEGIQTLSLEWGYHYRQGQESYQKKDYKKAVEHFKKAAEFNPTDFRTYFNIGASYYAMKDLEEAKKNWDTALKYKKDDLVTMRLISLAQKGMDRREEIEDIKRLLKKDPSSWKLHARLADAYSRDKDTVNSAEREYLKVLELNPSHIPTYDRLIELSEKLDEYDKAIQFATKRLQKTGPDDPSGKKKIDSLLTYKRLMEKGREDWTTKGITPYNEMVSVLEGNSVLFFIDKYEVTNAQYHAFLKATNHAPPPRWDDNLIKGKENYPVTAVSWYDAVMYCKWSGKRLPTEEEWIKAGWGTNYTDYPWGDNFDVGMANTGESGFEKTTPVGSYASHYGVYDMVGNVMEWTVSKKLQSSTDDTYKSRKGGSFLSDLLTIHPSAQWAAPPTQWDDATGFRCVKSATEGRRGEQVHGE